MAEEKKQLSEYDQLMLEKQKLEVELMRQQVKDQQDKQNAQKLTGEQQEAMIRNTQRVTEEVQKQCNHRKGGKGLEGLSGNGNANDYCMIHHVYANNKLCVMCSRCVFQWWPGTTEDKMCGMDGKVILDNAGKPRKNPTGVSYNTAARWPTDNEASGGVTFAFERTEVAV